MTKKIEITEVSELEMAAFQENANILATKHQTPKVHIYVGVDEKTNDRIVAYLKEPSYIQKIVALDKIATVGMFMAADEMKETLLLKEESDPRSYSENPECDGYRLGITGTCVQIIQVVQNSFKKK